VNPALKPVRYVFYRILSWKLKHGHDSNPVLGATLTMSGLLILNAMLVGEVVLTRSGREWPAVHRSLPLYFGAAGALLLMHMIMYYAWVAKGRFGALQAEFDAPGPRRQTVRSISFWSYVVLSVATPIVFAIIVGMIKGPSRS
jgi:hypothetical protein